LFGESRVAVDYVLETQHMGKAVGSARDLRRARILLCGVYRARLACGSAQIGGSRGIR
jgi:hypothetical protein